VQTYEANVVYADGTRHDVTFYKATFVGADGALGGLVGTILDITDRKRAEAALRASEERYRGLIEGSIQGVLVHRSWMAHFVNAAAATMFGYAPEELIGLDVRARIAPEDLARVESFGAARLRGEHAPSRYEFQGVRKDGTRIRVEAQASLVSWEGEPAVLSTLIDVTERRRAEATLRQQEERLRESQRVEAIGRLAGGVAHEFNNLLTVIIGRADLLSAGLDPAHRGQRDLDLIKKAGERAATLTGQLLAFSRKQILQPKVLDLNQVVGGMAQLLRPLLEDTLEVVTSLAPEPVSVKADPTQIQQVIMNLVLNSRDAVAGGGGRVSITTARAEPDPAGGLRGVLEVADTGCGMSLDVQAHLFEPFFTTKEVGKGTGLGLATVYGIVKQHEGDIAVTSAPDQGTTVRIYLPLVTAPVEATAVVSPPAPRTTAPGSATVLLVEDEWTVREFVRDVLHASGYRVLSAATPAEAEALAERHAGRIDLLLTDVIMPELSGRELADRLVRRRTGLRVLYISGYTDDVLARHGVLEAGTSFLAKPFSPDALTHAVQEVLRSPDPGAAEGEPPS
jgi:PAS domain S-box-containing protein